MKTNAEELARLMHWPMAPLRVQWQVLEPGTASGFGPSDWQLAAVLEFKPEDRARLLQGAAPAAIDHLFPPAFVLPWFPQALKDRFQPQADGQARLQDTPLEAAAFQSSPLSNGFFVPFGSAGGVFVYLYTR